MGYSGLVYITILYIHINVLKRYKCTEFSYKYNYFAQQIYIHIFVQIMTNKCLNNFLLILKQDVFLIKISNLLFY